MSIYQGDVYTFLLVLKGTGGVDPTVSGTPTITVVDTSTNTAVITAQNMTLITGTKKVYKYAWSIPSTLPSRRYIAIASYSVDLAGGASYVAYTSVHIETVDVGDSRILGSVALDSTVAKDATVSKDATVAKASDLTGLNPNNSTVVMAIKAKTDLLPSTPANEATLTTIQGICTDAKDGILAHMTIDKTVNPNTLTLRRLSDNAIVATFTLTDDASHTIRTRTA